jgi:Secretion system C-terminal sorting domain
MKKLCFILLFALPLGLQAQKTINASGNWTSSGSWLGGVPANGPTDDVTMLSGTAITIQAAENVSSGAIDAGNNNTLTVDPSGDLQVGDAGNSRDLTAGTSMAIVANNGTITIWGDLIVNNSLALTIQGPSGSIIIKHNVILADGASLIVNGTLIVEGDFTGGLNTNVTVGAGGAIGVSGTLTVGVGSHVNLNCTSYSPDVNCGVFHAHACGAGTPAAFCSSLPVELISFNAESASGKIKLNWATASEINFDYFIVEKSSDGKLFTEMASVPSGKTPKIRTDYALDDKNPVLGRSYYRLTEVDLDRSVHSLRIIGVNYTGGKTLHVFPNPVTNGQLNFELNFVPVPEKEVTISIVDLRGTLLSEFVLGEQRVTVPVQLPTGIYAVMLRSSDFRSVSKLVVK